MAILGLAALLRLVGIRYGLPLAVLNPDEASIVPRAWRMGQGHLDPGWYDYPSLLMGAAGARPGVLRLPPRTERRVLSPC